MKQTIGNACGTIGVLHAIGNNRQAANLRTPPVVRDASASSRGRMHQHLPSAAGEGSFLNRFFDATAGMNPTEVGAFLENPPEGAPSIDEAHAVSADLMEVKATHLSSVQAVQLQSCEACMARPDEVAAEW